MATDTKRLGPIPAFFLYHTLGNFLFWLGLFVVAIYANDPWAASLYNWLSPTPLGPLFAGIYEWGLVNKLSWIATALIGFSILRAYVKLKVTRFAIEHGVLVVTHGKFSLNPFEFFRRVDYTVALNLIYDVDVKKTLFQYIFGGGDVYLRTASNDVFHLEFVSDVHGVRAYLLEHSGIKNKPVIGIY